jgi:hypothetical protein
MQAQLTGHGDLLDEEVGALSQAVGKLKGMVTQIGEESQETGKIQDAVAKQLEAAQVHCSQLPSAHVCASLGTNTCALCLGPTAMYCQCKLARV